MIKLLDTIQKPNLNLLAFLNHSKIQIIDKSFKNYFKIISNDKVKLDFDNIISITDKIYLILAKSFCSAIPNLLLVEFGKDEKNNYQIIKFDDKDIININDKILDIFSFKQKIESISKNSSQFLVFGKKYIFLYEYYENKEYLLLKNYLYNSSNTYNYESNLILLELGNGDIIFYKYSKLYLFDLKNWQMKAIIKLGLECYIKNLHKIDKYKIICGNNHFLKFPKLILEKSNINIEKFIIFGNYAFFHSINTIKSLQTT